MKNVVFRVDASIKIGNGHVMRCLALASALATKGVQCCFICREYKGHLLDLIQQRGFKALGLSACQDIDEPNIANELGTELIEDAEQTRSIIKNFVVDWLIVDHYGVDHRWEQKLRGACHYLMVIDDLANRQHDCDLLLDQNLGRIVDDYTGLLPMTCKVLTGPQYALLRTEFSALRSYSLNRRTSPQLKHLLITMGGSDQFNMTGQILATLKDCQLPMDCHITVVLGPHAPWLKQVQLQSAKMLWKTEVFVNVQDMARLMANSDLAISAAGSTVWEGCCLGIPMLVMTVAENQINVAANLEYEHAVLPLKLGMSLDQKLPMYFDAIIQDNRIMTELTMQASKISDGLGSERVMQQLSGF